jgi:uridine kinase
VEALGVYSYIEKHVSALRKPAIVGIDGAVTSGKTMFSQMLERYLNNMGYPTQSIHIDDFHKPRSVRMKGYSPEHYFDNAIDTQKFGELITAMKRGGSKTISVLHLGTDTYANRVYTADANTLVIVEGVLLYTPAIRRFFDYKIFLDIDDDEILRRGKERDVPLYGEDILRQYIDLYIPVHKIYVGQCYPKKQSDLVIDNNNVREPMIVK